MPGPLVRWITLLAAAGVVVWVLLTKDRAPVPSFAKYCKIPHRPQAPQCAPGFVLISSRDALVCKPCPSGQRSENNTCVALLGCTDLEHIAPPTRLTAGGVKTIFK
jgi:hypothetical protein